jgi:Cft2 family RNA processing exonuclease
MIELNHGIRLIGSGLWLDATRPRELAFASHAHGDHIAKHTTILSTPPTARFIRHRLGKKPMLVPLSYREPYSVDGVRVELYPAGHMLGSAQILIESDRKDWKGRRVVYTGDIKLHPGRTSEAIEVPQCDVLIIESTFGRPRYVFPPAEEAAQRTIRFIEETLEDRRVPILFAYAMGKGPEAVKLLGDAGYIVCVPKEMIAILKLYEQEGVRFGPYEPLDLTNLFGKVVLLPPVLARSRLVHKIPNRRTAVLTGWAVDPDCAERYGADEAIPLSDHADFNELLEYVKRAQPKQVYTVHGFPDLAAVLRKQGLTAEHLAPGMQLGLW